MDGGFALGPTTTGGIVSHTAKVPFCATAGIEISSGPASVNSMMLISSALVSPPLPTAINVTFAILTSLLSPGDVLWNAMNLTVPLELSIAASRESKPPSETAIT